MDAHADASEMAGGRPAERTRIMEAVHDQVRRAAAISAALSLVAVSGTACGRGAAPPPTPPPSVAVAEVVKQDVPVQMEWVSTLDGYVNANIKPQVTGYLVAQTYVEGSYVKQGDVLFAIDPRPFQAQLAQVRAQMAQAQAQLGKATRDVARDIPLAEGRAIARSQLEDDVQAKRAAAATLEAARAAVRNAELNLEFTKVRSLTDGIAGIAQAQLGDLVGQSTVLTSVSRVDPIKAYVSLSEREYLQFVGGDGSSAELRPFPDGDIALELLLDGGNAYPHQGRFVIADRQVDPKTGTIRVAAAFPNPGNVLRPGQFGRVRATVSVRRDALLVPQRAVSELQGMHQVAVVGNDNKVAIRQVKVGPRVGTSWVIDDGVAQGEKVVVEGIQKIRDGAQVTPAPFQPVADTR
jgi:membrane fusion protein (multidrug efflux system)